MLLGFGIIAIPTGILTVSGCAITSSDRLSWSAAAAGVMAPQGCPSLRCLRCVAALQGLKSGCCRVLLSLLAGSAFGFRQVSALDAHSAAEAFGVAVLAAAFSVA